MPSVFFVKKGRYGGTYAHKDIAFEFASAISPVFKLYLIKEFQHLKEQGNDIKKMLLQVYEKGIYKGRWICLQTKRS